MPTQRRRRTQRKRCQRGGALDVQKWIAKTGKEFHWPGYQYMGPGTHLAKRLKRGDPGINRLDQIAKQHDIDYSRAKNLQDKWKADTKMIQAIDRLPGKKTKTERVVKRIMQAKKRLNCKHFNGTPYHVETINNENVTVSLIPKRSTTMSRLNVLPNTKRCSAKY